jgi:hypothetical protein
MTKKMANVYNYHCIQVDDILLGILSKNLFILYHEKTKIISLKFRFNRAMIAFLDCVNQVYKKKRFFLL